MSMEDEGPLKRTSWKECEQHIDSNHALSEEGVILLNRLPKYQEIYRAQRRRNLQIYVKYSDYIKQKFLRFKTKKILCDDNEWKLKAIDDESYKHCALFPNSFPYHFEANIGHFVLWSTDEMSQSAVDKHIGKLYPNQPFLWWVNPKKKRSVPDVYHCQVLIKMDRMSRENKILHGFVRDIIKKSTCYISDSLFNQMMMYTLSCL